MALPRLVFLVIAVSVMTILLGVFFGQHVYLVLTNQTTNERYKLHEVNFHHSNTDNSNDPCDNSTGSGNRKKRRVGRNIKTDDPVKVDLSVYRPYSRGYMKNAMEVFLPHNFIQSKIKQT